MTAPAAAAGDRLELAVDHVGDQQLVSRLSAAVVPDVVVAIVLVGLVLGARPFPYALVGGVPVLFPLAVGEREVLKCCHRHVFGMPDPPGE
jgi:hypothetical protein